MQLTQRELAMTSGGVTGQHDAQRLVPLINSTGVPALLPEASHAMFNMSAMLGFATHGALTISMSAATIAARQFMWSSERKLSASIPCFPFQIAAADDRERRYPLFLPATESRIHAVTVDAFCCGGISGDNDAGISSRIAWAAEVA